MEKLQKRWSRNQSNDRTQKLKGFDKKSPRKKTGKEYKKVIFKNCYRKGKNRDNRKTKVIMEKRKCRIRTQKDEGKYTRNIETTKLIL